MTREIDMSEAQSKMRALECGGCVAGQENEPTERTKGRRDKDRLPTGRVPASAAGEETIDSDQRHALEGQERRETEVAGVRGVERKHRRESDLPKDNSEILRDAARRHQPFYYKGAGEQSQ